MARSRRPYAESVLHAASARSTSSAETVLGMDECRHVRTAGTAPSKPTCTASLEAQKRTSLRRMFAGDGTPGEAGLLT